MPYTWIRALAREVSAAADSYGFILNGTPLAHELISRTAENFKGSAEAARVRLAKLRILVEERSVGTGLFCSCPTRPSHAPRNT